MRDWLQTGILLMLIRRDKKGHFPPRETESSRLEYEPKSRSTEIPNPRYITGYM